MRISLALMSYAILLICILNYFSLGFASKMKNETDRLALLALKNSVSDDPDGILNSWNSSAHYCNWKGISCSKKHLQRVTGLNLSSHGLVGSLPSHIGNLSFLKFIILQNNFFHSEIPQEIGHLHRLRLLDLNHNSFSGKVPTNLTSCINLREIDFKNNNISGKIPVELSFIRNLVSLNLSQNNFKGEIPPSIGNFSSLIWLSLAETRLEGSIPEDIGQMTRLQYLVLVNNNLTGSIPSNVYNLSKLIVIGLAVNRLEGNLRTDIGVKLPNLKWLGLGGNRFTGSLPSSLSNASQLQFITLSYNMFSGQVPVEFGRLVNLSFLALYSNMFGTLGGNDMSLIFYLKNCSKLERLYLGRNLLRGEIPKSIANLSTSLQYLSLGENNVYGIIPSGITNLVNLNLLDFHDLMLNGHIPDEIGNLRNLVKLRAGGNALTEQIPASIGNLTALNVLHLEANNLSGKIPPSLENCQNLVSLDLSQNGLDSYISISLFRVGSLVFINLSHNSLAGSFPQDVGNLKQLETLDVSKNKLSGRIPSSLGFCVTLMNIYMNNNSFNGLIPQELSSLRGLVELDLSFNNFSGTIPEYLGKLPFLKMLNLSFNDFHGQVPENGNFKNVSLSSLIGNPNLCGGLPELKFTACADMGSSLAFKVTVPLSILAIFLALLAAFLILRFMRNKVQLSPSSASINNQFIMISYQELLQATEGFSSSNLIGLGSHGSVYKGFVRRSQSSIAVKVFDSPNRRALQSFVSECKALTNIRHRNLLKVLSVCSGMDYRGNDFNAIVFEFMSRGNLNDWLHSENNESKLKTLNLDQRLNIVLDVSFALEYLHCHCQPPIIHCDLKPSNVLLDEEMVAHVSDFGISIILFDDSKEDQFSSAIMKGSIGYVAPEYGMNGTASTEGDVYSFGILVLEMLTGKRPIDDMFKDDQSLDGFVRNAIPEKMVDILDPELVLEEDIEERTQECMLSMLQLGLSCSVDTPKDRIKIRDAVRELDLIKRAYQGKPIFHTS